MVRARPNDAKAKRLRAQLRAQGNPCHICGEAIAYEAHHLHPRAFQVDHLWQVANGGPEYEPENCAAAHRYCNRQRSDRIDSITIAAAAHYGVVIKRPTYVNPRFSMTPACAPAGQLCTRCNGTHHPRPGVTFETARRW
ncbi:HNH endonuclease signature motif containing protein [Mycolicibacter senuensis]|uniref:HNH nuclease domain-containing protein n=1 Tax=Mycolicibacter senuensis TaxID=386913 RepID=A0A7I9XQS0_9MYCO|nr:HNH endonuclease signature motif containing protein [Mycolicibacter senuensis]ORW69690.1 hypothetical protein AWC24_04680 [Mycolicibacter senuensis]GFG71840.1 hypothetical protein MSEN_35600 [Mycolicibacter senuensis]